MFCVFHSYGQGLYSFGLEGNACHFDYMVVHPVGMPQPTTKPYVFVVAKAGETAKQCFERDSLRDTPQFFEYNFIYVPTLSSTNRSTLDCLEALKSLVTYQYATRRNPNLFLYCYDEDYFEAASQNATVRSTFRSILNDEDFRSGSRSSLELNKAMEAQVVEEEIENEWVEEEGDLAAKSQGIKAEKTFFGPPSAFNFTFSGVVRDRSTGESLPFSLVKIMSNSSGVSTNADGFFTLSNVPTDTTTLEIQYMGYRTERIFLNPIMPKKGVVIQMSPDVLTMKQVNIVGVKEDVVLINNRDVGIVKLTPKKLEQLPNLGERDVMRSFQLMPGVGASNESSSGLYVRGGTPDQNLVLYDGFTVYQVDHLYGFFSAFNANAIKDVQLHKGGFESKFGGRLSSVTEITGKEGNQKRFNIGGDLSLLSINAFVEVPFGKKVSSILTYRRSYKGPLYNKIFEKFNSSDEDDEAESTGPGPMNTQTEATSYFYDLNGKVTFRPNEKDVLSISFFNGTDKLDNSQSISLGGPGGGGPGGGFATTDLTKYGNVGLSGKWSRKWTEKLYVNTVVSYSNYYSKRDRSQSGTITNSDGEEEEISSGIFENNDLRDYSIKSDYQWNLAKWSELQFGLFSSYYDIDYTYAQNDTTTILEKHDKSWIRGAFLQNRFSLGNDKILFVPGVRLSHFSRTDQLYVEPRASLIYNVNKMISLKAATGKYYQFVNRITREDILSGSRDFWLLSNGNSIPVSQSIHYMGGVSVDLSNYLFSVEAYYKQLSDLTEYSLRINSTPFSVDYEESFIKGTGYAKGIEFLVQRKTGKLNGWMSYTRSLTRSQFDAYGLQSFAANQDAPHEFKSVAIYNHKRWGFSATWIYASGRPYTAPSGAYTVTLLDGSEQEYFTVTSKNALRLPNYHRADISVTYKILRSVGERKKDIGSIGFSIFNIYNRKNIWYKQFSIVDSTIIETDVNYVGFTPNLTLTLKLR